MFYIHLKLIHVVNVNHQLDKLVFSEHKNNSLRKCEGESHYIYVSPCGKNCKIERMFTWIIDDIFKRCKNRKIFTRHNLKLKKNLSDFLVKMISKNNPNNPDNPNKENKPIISTEYSQYYKNSLTLRKVMFKTLIVNRMTTNTNILKYRISSIVMELINNKMNITGSFRSPIFLYFSKYSEALEILQETFH